MNDLSTHLELNLDLWLEVGSFNRSDKNQVFDISNTMAEEL